MNKLFTQNLIRFHSSFTIKRFNGIHLPVSSLSSQLFPRYSSSEPKTPAAAATAATLSAVSKKKKAIIRRNTGGLIELDKERDGNQNSLESIHQPSLCIAYSTAEAYNFSILQNRLELEKDYTIQQPDITRDVMYITHISGAEIFVFRSGSFVSWGWTPEESENFALNIIRSKNQNSKNQIEILPYNSLETEDVEYILDPNERTRMQGDRIYIGSRPAATVEAASRGHRDSRIRNLDKDQEELQDQVDSNETSPTLAKFAFSHGLARSSKLAVLEEQLDSYLVETADIPQVLASGRPLRLGRSETLQKMGQLLRYRQRLNLNSENFLDFPDYYWSKPILEIYYTSISRNLDVRARLAILNEKIGYASEVVNVLKQHLAESTSHKLEWIIVILIAVEVVLALGKSVDWNHLFSTKSDQLEKGKKIQIEEK